MAMVMAGAGIADSDVAHIEVMESGTAGFEVDTAMTDPDTVGSGVVDETVHTAAANPMVNHPVQPAHTQNLSALVSAVVPQIAAVSPSPTAFPSYTPPSPFPQSP
jgi:hypothetical protein